MIFSFQLWEFISLIGVVFGGLIGLIRLLLVQFERRLDERFAALDRARSDGQQAWSESFLQHVQAEQREFDALRNLDRSFMEFRASLPVLYIRRDELRDYLVRLDMRFESLNDKLSRLILPEDAAHASTD